MELLLNLFWLLLALTAIAAGCIAGNARGVSRLRCFLLLGCISLLVFPIVSASDDLRALATEFEDAAVSTPDSLKHAKFQATNCANHALASSRTNAGDLVPPSDEPWQLVIEYTYQLPMQGPAKPMACRPPPNHRPPVLVATTKVATQHRLGIARPGDGEAVAQAAAQKLRCLGFGEWYGEHDVRSRADDFGNPLTNRRGSSTT